jgi:hypothetical protein
MNVAGVAGRLFLYVQRGRRFLSFLLIPNPYSLIFAPHFRHWRRRRALSVWQAGQVIYMARA